VQLRKKDEWKIKMEMDLSRFIPFAHIVSDGVIGSNNGDFMSTWRIFGIDATTKNDDDLQLELAKLNSFIRTLATGEFTFYTHRIPKKTTLTLSIPTNNLFVENLLHKYYGKLNENLHTTEHYLTVIYRPQKASNKLGFAFKLKAYKENKEKAIGLLQEIGWTLKANFKEYDVERLGSYTDSDVSTDSDSVYDENARMNRVYNSQAEFYAFLINGEWQKVPENKKQNLAKLLPTSRIIYGTFYKEIITASGGRKFSYFIDMKDYASETFSGILDTLINLPYEFIETQTYSPLVKADALAALNQIRGQLISAEDDGVTQVSDLDNAKEEVVNGAFVFGQYSYQIEVFGDTLAQAKDARLQVMRMLAEEGFLPSNIDSIVNHAHLSTLPGNFKHRTRTAYVSSRNFAGLNSLHNFSFGKKDLNPWGEALIGVETANGQPFYLNLHESPVGVDSTNKPNLGNTGVFGKSGTGKTVFTNMVILSSFKYGTKSVYFDKDRGCEIGIRAYGGAYINIFRNEKSGLAPFKREQTPANIAFEKELIKHCAKEGGIKAGGYRLSPVDEDNIDRAVEAVATHDKSERGFELVIQYLDPTDPNGIAARLRKWTKNGVLGWALDNDEDELNFKQSGCTGIDYTELLDDKEVCPAVMLYLLFRTESEIDGKPFMYVMEEFWKALENESFTDFAKNKQKTIRKLNGLGLFVTQQISDALSTSIAKTLIEQMATMIFLPNPQADEKEYCEGFKCTKLEYEIIKSLAPNSRMFLFKQGSQSTLLRLSLNGMDDELEVISGTKENLPFMEQARADVGENPDKWVPYYLELIRAERKKTSK
jgi:type IV secretion system protein VirB4